MADKILSSAFGSGSKEYGGIDDMFQHLQLIDDELDEVVLYVEVVKEYKREAQWMSIGKILTMWSFSATMLFVNIKSIYRVVLVMFRSVTIN